MTVEHIHLVDVVMETVMHFQEELDTCVSQRTLHNIKEYDYYVWTEPGGVRPKAGRSYPKHVEFYISDEDEKSKDKNDRKFKDKTGGEEEDECCICLEKPQNPKVLEKCKHTFCRHCIDEYFKRGQPKCPICSVVYGELRGTQPDDGSMNVCFDRKTLPGFRECGTIVINYFFPDGVQTVCIVLY